MMFLHLANGQWLTANSFIKSYGTYITTISKACLSLRFFKLCFIPELK
ncbi:hypothetical protein PITCH_A360025 [uncultured Desulfobacterium sp.]|uniref:Uncharacterized protein n=1 Tax=uncultured Desulfobacterium sp. TaxID=201089 RepID=A0A445MZG1_9BACT|nr:hypothetical protein PITCH_A360025 [uncultured Desulfobacterium sp.]